MYFFNPFLFGFAPVSPREQTLASLKSILRYEQNVDNAKKRIERLEKERQSIINERDGRRLKNTHDVSSEKRAKQELKDGVEQIWKKVNKTNEALGWVDFLVVALMFTCMIFYLIDTGILARGYFPGVLVAIECVLLYWVVYGLFDWLCQVRTYTEKRKDKKSMNAEFVTGCVFFLIAFLPVYWISKTADWTFLGILSFFLSQTPLMLCGISIKLITAIIVKLVYRKCDLLERCYVYKKNKEVAEAAEQDEQGRLAYQKEKSAWLAQRQASYAPKIAAKEKEIAEAKNALNQIPVCAEYMTYPFLKNSGIGYISALIDLVERGKADTVKEAMNMQDQINDRLHKETMDKLRRQAFESQINEGLDALKNDYRRTRAAAEEYASAAQKAADELERIRKQVED